MIAPILDEIDREYGERLTIVKVNGDEEPEITRRYGVMGFPTLKLFRAGEVVHEIIGAKPKRRLLAEVEPHL